MVFARSVPGRCRREGVSGGGSGPEGVQRSALGQPCPACWGGGAALRLPSPSPLRGPTLWRVHALPGGQGEGEGEGGASQGAGGGVYTRPSGRAVACTQGVVGWACTHPSPPPPPALGPPSFSGGGGWLELLTAPNSLAFFPCSSSSAPVGGRARVFDTKTRAFLRQPPWGGGRILAPQGRAPP